MLRLTLLIVCALFGTLVAVPGAGVAQPAPSSRRAEAPTIQKEGFSFPSRLAGFQRGEMTDYEATSPGLGFSFEYATQRAWANVYIYDNKPAIPLDAGMETAAAERESALGEIDHFVKNGTYQSATVTSRAAYGAFAKATLVIMQNGKPRNDFAYVTIHKGKFVKLRVSTFVDAGSAKAADNLASAVAQLLR